jgi:predicted DsbA family dithiol-disulfide isomerase
MQTSPPPTLDFVADIICPWCAIALRRLVTALAELAAEGLIIRPVWRPFLLYPAMPPHGVPQPDHLRRRFGTLAAAERYHAGVTEAGRTVGLDIRYDRITVTPNSLDAHRLLLLAAIQDRPFALADAMASAFLEQGHDIGDRTVLCRLTGAAGLDPAEVGRMFGTDHLLAEVLSSNARARRAGILQVPAYCLHGRILTVPDIDDLAGTLRRAHRALSAVSPG